MKFTIFQNSLQGPRSHNQDRLAYSYSKDALLLVVADGMGGHRYGEIAAQLAITNLTDAFQRQADPTIVSPAKFLIEQIDQIHSTISQFAADRELIESPRTTVVAAIVQRGILYCAHAGDSRLYHFRNGELLFRTEDHSVVQSLYNKGKIEKNQMATHPFRHKVYSCLGGETPPKIELADRQELADGDTILLCTDGVWNVLTDDQIMHILMQGNITAGITDLLDQAEAISLTQGDNMSAIGLQWGDKLRNPQAVSTVNMGMEVTTTMMSPTATQNFADQSEFSNVDISDEEIEKTISAIQEAIRKTR
ncbi:MAG: protein phosphatase 2C domain-containing protein [Methylophilaceae bacterium]